MLVKQTGTPADCFAPTPLFLCDLISVDWLSDWLIVKHFVKLSLENFDIYRVSAVKETLGLLQTVLAACSVIFKSYQTG